MLFELEDLVYHRDARVVIDGVSARIPRGMNCLLGPSGSGKSTLLRLLNRLADPISGRIAYEGRDVRELDVLALRREACLVPQVPALIDGSVADNIAFGPNLAGRRFDSPAALELAGLDPGYASRPADRLSVGEQQRVMLARALALEPRVLLLDEPTSALDTTATASVERTLAGLWSRAGISLLLVTHDLEQAERMASHVLCMDGGRAIGEGPAAEAVPAERERRIGAATVGS